VPLQSELFRDDNALQACLVRDSAHVLRGARGRHVTRIQTAIAILDGTLMDADELEAAVYGPSTAAAVLAYKRARDIINRSYQQRADDIVGKMTIASLDREMLAAEQRKMGRVCREPTHGPAPMRRRDVVAQGIGDASVPQLPAILSVLFQFVRVGNKLGPHTFAIFFSTIRRANELVAPFGMRVAHIPGFGFSIPHKPKITEPEEFLGLRKSAELAFPGFKPALRVLVCPLRKNDAQDDDLTNNAISMSVAGFDRFIVINSNLLRQDNGTLLHEMIHCSADALMGEFGVHDPDGSGSIFSWDSNRPKLPLTRARALRDAFFSFKR
jgi:hypothetical protein